MLLMNTLSQQYKFAFPNISFSIVASINVNICELKMYKKILVIHIFHYVLLSHVHYVTILFCLWMTPGERILIISKCSLGATACIFDKAI